MIVKALASALGEMKKALIPVWNFCTNVPFAYAERNSFEGKNFCCVYSYTHDTHTGVQREGTVQ